MQILHSCEETTCKNWMYCQLRDAFCFTDHDYSLKKSMVITLHAEQVQITF